jgi:hypothetical protein
MIDTRRDCLTCLREAATVLAGPTGTDKEKFLKAGQLFWSALIYLDSWPPNLADRAQQIARRFMERGTVEYTANRLEPKTIAARVPELVQCVCELATDVERAVQNRTFGAHGEPFSSRRV